MTENNKINSNKKSNEAGFSLLEVSLSVIILGFVSVAIVQLVFAQREIHRDLESKQRYETVRSAIAEFIKEDPSDPTDVMNYPCPADPTLAVESASFGVEQREASGACKETGGIQKVVGTDGQDVFIGAIPTKTLHIGNINALDMFNRQLTYAVSSSMALPNALAAGGVARGAITVKDSKDPLAVVNTEYAPFVFVAHGKNGVGSYTATGAKYGSNCSVSGNGDSENCNGDAVFALLQTSEVGSDKDFDDILAYNIADKRVTIETCPDGARMVGIVKGQPECKKITMVCPVGEYLVGISNDTPLCQGISSASGPSSPTGGTTITRNVNTSSNSNPNTTTSAARVSNPTSSVNTSTSSSSQPEEGWLGAAYRTNLGRAPDAAGASFWLAQEKAGMSRTDIIKTISGGCEATSSCGNTSSGQKELQGQANYASSYTSNTGTTASSRSTESAARTTAATSTAQYDTNPYIKTTTASKPAATVNTYKPPVVPKATNTYVNTYKAPVVPKATNTYVNTYKAPVVPKATNTYVNPYNHANDR